MELNAVQIAQKLWKIVPRRNIIDKHISWIAYHLLNKHLIFVIITAT